jgi:hypothetical protein
MGRFPQPSGTRGSLKWIQRAVNGRWPSLDEPILASISGAKSIAWVSPREHDDFAEYRDIAFLEKLGVSELAAGLQTFWPSRGPQWDALGRTDNGALLLVEAKAHIAEMCSSGTGAGEVSRARITARLEEVATALGARPNRAAWTEFFYQLANRIAHLHFLRRNGAPAWLVLVNFLNDREMGGPTTSEAWRAAYDVAFHVMGLGKRHALTPYIIEVFPVVAAAP